MLTKDFLLGLQQYIDSKLYMDSLDSLDLSESRNNVCYSKAAMPSTPNRMLKKSKSINDFVNAHLQPTFAELLFNFIDERGLKDSDVYKKAMIDRRLFSKIRSNPHYQPSKNTVIALSLSLELSLNDTNKFMSSAGYSLSDSNTFDLVIKYCLEKEMYNIIDVNEALDYFSLKPLCV